MDISKFTNPKLIKTIEQTTKNLNALLAESLKRNLNVQTGISFKMEMRKQG